MTSTVINENIMGKNVIFNLILLFTTKLILKQTVNFSEIVMIAMQPTIITG